MKLQMVEAIGFRNHQHTRYEPSDGLNLLVGGNGQGKTNLLEAIYFLSTLQSFKASRLEECVAWGSTNTYLSAALGPERPSHLLKVELRAGSRTASIDGKLTRRTSDYTKWLRTVLFTSEDLGVLRGAPAFRRRFFDRMIQGAFPAYDDSLREYGRILAQKAALLAQPDHYTTDELHVWNTSLAHHGARLISTRSRFCRRLQPLFERHVAQLSAGEWDFSLSYQSEASGAKDGSIQSITEALLDAFERALERERGAGRVLLGPHRDDYLLRVGTHPLESYGSQGQTRLATLALKLAEIDLIREVTSQLPVLLLDDISSELDDHRTRQLIAAVTASGCQTILTTARPDALAGAGVGAADVCEVVEGRIIRREDWNFRLHS